MFDSISFHSSGHSSSPESSPPTLPVDSSPLSSPLFQPLALDDSWIPPVDPFSASYSVNRAKRTNEYSEWLPDEDRASKKARRGVSGVFDRSGWSEEEEDDIWEAASVLAYDEDVRIFDLNEKGLTRIPTGFVRDLMDMVVLPGIVAPPPPPDPSRRFERVSSSAVVAARSIRRTFSRTDSRRAHPGEQDGNIHFYLANNSISKLPRELFMLTNLVTLSLRMNLLRYLPPEIALLTQLRDLNVAGNKLSYLPCEINRLKSLQSLQLFPGNLFMDEPESATPEFKSVTAPRFTTPGPVPSLVELGYRSLVSPPSESTKAKLEVERETLLHYYLPIGPEVLSGMAPPVAEILNACVPGSIPFGEPTEDEATGVTGTGLCPNPSHEQPRRFVRHLEERTSWETRINGLDIGGTVPVRWRGCARGCLLFLDKQKRDDEPKKVEVVAEAEEYELEFAPVNLSRQGGLGFD